jgi:cysteine sulfinate desulfinase/cysteine desulfurase-like protein
MLCYAEMLYVDALCLSLSYPSLSLSLALLRRDALCRCSMSACSATARRHGCMLCSLYVDALCLHALLRLSYGVRRDADSDADTIKADTIKACSLMQSLVTSH